MLKRSRITKCGQRLKVISKIGYVLRLSKRFSNLRPYLVSETKLVGDELFCPLGMDTFTPLLHTFRTPYMHTTNQSPASRVIQRSQSTPNVGVRPATVQLRQAPRRTKTSIDFLVAAPPSAIYKDGCEDPFGLAGFFPPRPRTPHEGRSGWWRDESPEDDSEPTKMINDDSSALGLQRVLFSTREEQQAETIIEHEDKLGVLSILTGKWPNWEDETTEDHLRSPYTSDETCDDEAVRLAYERRRNSDSGQPWDNECGKRTNKLFFGREEEEEAAGSSWFG